MAKIEKKNVNFCKTKDEENRILFLKLRFLNLLRKKLNNIQEALEAEQLYSSLRFRFLVDVSLIMKKKIRNCIYEKALDAEKKGLDSLAFSYYLEAAQSGDANAMYHVAYGYIYGKGTSTNIIEGAAWMQVAIDNGNAAAMRLRGDCHFNELAGLVKSAVVGKKWYIRAAENGDVRAITHLKSRYKLNNEHILTILHWLSIAIESGSTTATNKLLQIYQDEEYSDYLNKHDKAYLYWKKMGHLNSGKAMGMIGDMYRFGLFVRKNPTRALKWYCNAYDAGNNDVIRDIATIFSLIGRLDEGEKWMNKAINYEEKMKHCTERTINCIMNKVFL